PVPAGPRGEDVAAFVVAALPVQPAALLEHCRAELESYKVPRHLWLRRDHELPVRSSGKVDKALLRAEAARLVGAYAKARQPMRGPVNPTGREHATSLTSGNASCMKGAHN